MNIVSSNSTIADFCQEMERRSIIVNKEYQRSDKIWPTVARGYLIETILLGYPIPKLALHQVTDVKSRKTIKEIVDGQQRSMAIFDFYNDKFSLSRTLDTEELQGKTYSGLGTDYQQKFLDYSLSLDLFVSTTPEQVREVFRRMNSYTVPLNAEEQRHATYQGPFKWFINRVAKRFGKGFVSMGLFGEKQIVRMADAKLLTEICDALLNGIRTTNKKILDKLYGDNDKEFPAEEMLEAEITEAFDRLLEWAEIHNSALMKPYIAYALFLAVIHVRHRVEALEPLFPSRGPAEFDAGVIVPNLMLLSEAAENPENAGEFEEFAKAGSTKGGTNVKAARETRFVWMCRALSTGF